MHLRPFVRPWSENEVCSGALLTRCYFEATEIDCTIDQLKPGLKSVARYLFIYLKSALVTTNVYIYAGPHSIYYTHRDAQQHTNMSYVKNERINVKYYYCVGYTNIKNAYKT